jgi:hypothetical protein
MKRGWITGAQQEAFGSNGALAAGPVHVDMVHQHRVLLHLGFLLHRLPAATSSRDPPAGGVHRWELMSVTHHVQHCRNEK